MSEPADTPAARLNAHITALDRQVEQMETRALRILHGNLDVTAAALDRAKASQADLLSIVEQIEQL